MLAAERRVRTDETHFVDNRLYTDPRAFDLERERIFERVWVFYCHESEVALPGQYLARDVAGSPVVVVRNAHGELRAFYNTCRHRGAMVADQQCGRAATLRCRYHWWTYSLDGDLLSVPGPEAYEPSAWRKEDYGLVPVRVGSVYGLVFVCLDPESPALEDFLGPDVIAVLGKALGGGAMEVFHQRALPVKANWKGWAENARDGYHVPFVHPFFLKASPPEAYHLLPNGHAVQYLGMKLDELEPDYAAKLLACPLPGVAPGEGFILMIFPDTGITLRSNMVSIESQIPVTVEESVLESRVLGLRGDTDAVRALRRLSWEAWINGPLSTEDHPIFELQQRGLHGKGVRHSFIGRGVDATTGTRGDDNRLRQFWAAWRQYMGVERNAL
ncbi:MAG TPA: aromatic ring-hydroxylating dioxygenase subunit alpha [Chloroflexota bacterium]|jgi:methanesulfonate monooxygenase large subunit